MLQQPLISVSGARQQTCPEASQRRGPDLALRKLAQSLLENRLNFRFLGNAQLHSKWEMLRHEFSLEGNEIVTPLSPQATEN